MTEEKKVIPEDDPLFQAVDSLAKSMENSVGNLDERVSKTEKEVQDQLKAVDDKLEKSIHFLADKIDQKNDFDAAVGRFRQGEGQALLTAIPENKRHLLNRAKTFSPLFDNETGKAVPETERPVAGAAMAYWFTEAFKAQVPKRFPQEYMKAGENANAIYTALQDYSGVTKAALSEGADAAGGYLVPDIISGQVLRIALDSSVVFSRARQIPMTSNRLEIPNEATAVTTNWVAEAGTVTAGEPVFGVNILDAKKIAGRALMSSEVEEDSLVSLLPYIVSVFGENFGREFDQEALEGDGTNLTGVESESSRNTAGNVTGAAITFTQLPAIMYAAGEESTRMGAAWFMSPQIFGTVVGMVDSNGQPVVHFAATQSAPFPTILGKPVYLTNVLSVAKTAGGVGSCGSIYFGDPRTLIFGIKRGFTFGVSEHSQWGTDQLDAKMTQRVGFTVANPGAWTEGQGFTKIGV